RARRPGAALRGPDVRLQVAQVARTHRGDRRAPPRLLGGAGLRRRRLGRTVERPGRRADLGVTADGEVRRFGRPGRRAERGVAAARAIQRCGRAERALHWATAAAVLACALTGLVLYVGPLTALVGRRTLVKDVHVASGLAMPVPLVLAYAGRW